MLNIKKYNYNLYDILFFISILFIGADKLSFEIKNFNFRYVQVLLIIITILFILNKDFKLKNILLFLPFLISNIISTYGSYDLFSSIGYILFTIFNYFFIFCLFYSWSSRNNVNKTLSIWKVTFIIQGFLLIMEFLLGSFGFEEFIFELNKFRGITRPSIWFYETSYLATYFSIYFSIFLYLYIYTRKKRYRNNMFFSVFFILFITSTTGYLALGIGFIAIILFDNKKIFFIKIKYLFKALFFLMILFMVGYIIKPDMISIFLGRLFTDGIIASAGNRIKLWSEAIFVFTNNFFFGVGPSAYQKYINSNIPPTNVTLEILANLGFFGFITFIFFIIGTILNSYLKVSKIYNENSKVVKSVIFSFFVFIIVLQANQNYLRLYMWMHLGILSGMSSRVVNERISSHENSI